MPIELDRKERNYGCVLVKVKGKYVCQRDVFKYKVTNETYNVSDLFELIVHKEIKPTANIYLTFKSGSLKINNTSFRFIDTNDLDKVEVFFPIKGNTPLVLGVITKVQRYYRLSELIKLKPFKNIFDVKSFGENELLDNLIKENNNQNNVITYRLDKKPDDTSYDGVVVEKVVHPSFEKYKHIPTGDLNGKTVYVLYKGKQLQLSRQSYRGFGSQLKTIQKKFYCEIIVWHFKLSNTDETNPPNYLELKEKNGHDSDIHTYYLEISDYVGVFWEQIEYPKLDDVITYLLDKKPRNSEKYNDNSIEVKKSSNDSFEFYTHTPDRVHVNKKGYLRFIDKDLELVQNDHLGDENTKLDKFNGHTYCRVSLYYYNVTGKNQKPEFLELIKEEVAGDCSSESQGSTCGSKCYLFQIADTEGVKWTQIDYQDLKNTTIFRLECKDEHTDGYEKKVVSNGSEESFKVYSHTPKENHKDKSGLLLFNWKMLTLQPTDGFSTSTPILKKLQGKKYCKVCVYYGKSHSTEPPLYLELVESTTSDCPSRSDTSSSNDYWLQRIDHNGHHWKQKIKPEDLSSKKPYDLIEEIKSYDKNSIMVRLTEKSKYLMSIIKKYRTDGVGEKTNPTKNIYNNLKTFGNVTYQYYEHDFSESNMLGNSNIDSLRIFIETIEIKIFDKYEMANLLYNPLKDTDKKIQVFFYPRDTVPLLFIWDNKPYSATKTDYFTKWKQISELRAPDFSEEASFRLIKSKLDEINKHFNEILLNNTDPQGYGISAPPSVQTRSGFLFKRVKVSVSSPTSPGNKFGKVIHTTSNKSSIGSVMLNSVELKNESGRSLIEALSDGPEFKSAAVVSVIAYYHRSDSRYTKPLLLGFVKTVSTTPDVFFERQSVDDIRWAKITPPDLRKLRQDTGLADKINNIHYNIGNLVKVRIDKQHVADGGDSYQVQLIPNTNGGGRETVAQQVHGKQITVTQNSSTTTQLTGYVCFTHHIPKNISTTSLEYVSGLRLYICQNQYLSTHEKGGSTLLPICYDPNKNDVKVYFYGNNGVTSIENLDNVPLLAEYNGNHYRPSSREGYFTRWDKVEVTAQEVESDNDGGKTLQQVLDEINKELNTIELYKTGSTGGYKYGIKQPASKAKNCNSGTKIEAFCSRVSVQREDKDHCYKKVIHYTTNKGPIGSVFLSGKVIHGIDSARLGAKCNKVEVYYHTSDSLYSKPLLIHILSQTNECSNNWFYRRNVEGTDWKHDEQTSKYNSESSIRDQLNQINASMSVFLYLQIDKQEQYEILAKSGSETKGKEHKAYIGIDKYGACYSYDPGTNYRCFKHKMSEYYNLNEADIRLALQTQEKPTLEVKITIVGHKLKLDKSDRSPLPTQLTYGPNEERKDRNPYVYFFEPSGDTDKVPLLFMFSQKCFVPESKENYFSKWKQVELDFVTKAGDLDLNEKIKIKLNQITRMLNVINLDTTSDTTYGDIEPPGGRSHRSLGANKRVIVTRNMENGQDYHAVTHSTEKTGCVGTVKYQNKELMVVDNLSTPTGKPWSEAIEVELKTVAKPTDIYNELTVYYHKTDRKYTNPLLIKISGSSGTHVRVHDLYYERAEKENNLKWKKVALEETLRSTDGSGLADKINRIYNAVNEKAIQLEQQPSSDHHDSNVVQNGQETSSSAGVDSSAKAAVAEPGREGPSSNQGPSGLLQPSTSHSQTETTDSNPITDNPNNGTINRDHPQEPVVGGGFLTRSDSESSNSRPIERGEKARPGGSSDGEKGAKGENGPPGPSGENGDQGDDASSKSGTEPNNSSAQSSEGGFFQNAFKYAQENPEIVGGGGGAVAGVGVIATAGAVIYKKCIVGSAVAAGKAAAKVAASAASGM